MSAKWSDPREQTGHGRRLQGILGRAGPRGRCKRLYGHRIRARSRRALIFFCQFRHLPRVKIHDRIYVFRVANVAELVDAPDLGSGAERCESSSLSVRTIKRKPLFYKINFKYVNGFIFFLLIVWLLTDCFHAFQRLALVHRVHLRWWVDLLGRLPSAAAYCVSPHSVTFRTLGDQATCLPISLLFGADA